MIALLLSSASKAHASNEAGLAKLDALALLAPAIIATYMFSTVDVVYGVQGRLLPRGWAIAQLLIPAPLMLATAVVEHEGDLEFRAWSAGFSLWFFAHGFASLYAAASDHPAAPKGKPIRGAGPRAAPIEVVPIEGGALIVGRGVL